MEVILLEKIHRLGDLGDTVKVRPGYGRNYLIPKRKAVPATPDNVAAFDERKEELLKAQNESLELAEKRAEELEGFSVVIAARAGAGGKLFGSVGTADIAEAASRVGAAIEKREVRLPDGPLRELGDYQVSIHLHADVDKTIAVEIRSEDSDSAI